MKRRDKSNGHSFAQQKLYDEQKKKDGVNEKDKVWFKNQK